MGRSKHLPAILAGLFLTACAAGPNFRSPQTQLPDTFSEGEVYSNGDISAKAWWTAFVDPQLNELVNAGLSRNLNILQAIEVVEQARQNAVASRSGLFPTVSGGGSATRANTTSGYEEEALAKLSASWVLDLFGQYRRSRESAHASLDAAYASADVARLTLISDLVSNYIDARYYQELGSIAQAELDARRDTLRLTRLRKQAGASSQLEVVQAEGLVNATLSDIPGYETRYRASVHRMSTLLGQPATTLLPLMDRKDTQPAAHDPVDAGIPADLIRNRPDIRKAERELAAAVANIGVAKAQLYPSLQLNGNISPTALILAGARTNISAWSFGPTLNIPIFQGGALHANVKSSESKARSAYLVWKQTVLNAVEEVENAMVAYSRDRKTMSALAAEVRNYRHALNLSKSAYKRGVVSLLNVLDSERSVGAARQNLAGAVRQTALDYVRLNIALGGGYAVGRSHR